MLKAVDSIEFKVEQSELFRRMTPGQTAAFAITRLEMAVNNGGYESFFRYHSGELVNAACAGLKRVNATKFAENLSVAVKLVPWKQGWPERDAREQQLDELEERDPDCFMSVDSGFHRCYEGEESLAKALVAYAFSHPSEFFVDADA